MGMAVGGRSVSLQMAIAVASVSVLSKEYLYGKAEFEEEKEPQHGSEKNLKVDINKKVKGKHKKPFYVDGRW